MSYPEAPDQSGKAPEHRDAMLRAKAGEANNTPMQKPESTHEGKMQFKTEKKEFEIVQIGTSAHNGHTRATFKLIVTKPFSAEAVFDANDIGQRQKVDGIVFHEFSNIAKALNTKQEVMFSLPADALKYIQETNEQAIAAIKAEAQAKKIENWFWAVGGDSGDLYLSSDVDTEFRPDLKAIKDTIGKTRGRGNIWQLLRDKSKPVERKTALYTDQWYEISNTDLMEIYGIIQRQEDEIGKQKKAKQEEREIKRQETFAKAKLTGERQVLARWNDECNDSEEECSIDNIIEYAMPDGTTKTERHHTY